MKRLLACAMLLSLGLFTLGCGEQKSTPAKKAGTTPSATAPTGTPAPTTPAPAPSGEKK